MLRNILPFILFACAGLEAGPAPSRPMVFHLDPAQTDVTFTLGDVLHTVHGNFKLKSGTIEFDPLTRKAGGAVIVDLASGSSGSGARDRRMQKDILESQRYPEAVFTPDRVDGQFAPALPVQLQVHGLFKIHGAEHEITLPIEVQMKDGAITATTHFMVPYVRWGMKNPSNFLLRVNDKVVIDIRTTGHTGETPLL